MKDLIETTIALIYSAMLLGGDTYGLKKIHDEVKSMTTKKIEQGLSSSEVLANSLTGEETGF